MSTDANLSDGSYPYVLLGDLSAQFDDMRTAPELWTEVWRSIPSAPFFVGDRYWWIFNIEVHDQQGRGRFEARYQRRDDENFTTVWTSELVSLAHCNVRWVITQTYNR